MLPNMRESNSGVVWLLTLVPPLLLIPLMIVIGRHGTWGPMRIAGLLLSLIGLAGLTVARVNLGNSFSIAPEARKLVTHGVYSRIRHPVYLFGALLIAGMALYIPLLYLLLLLVPVIPMQIIRAREENRVLEDAFGEEYREYRRKAWF